MKIIFSPSKSQSSSDQSINLIEPLFMDKAHELVSVLQSYSKHDLQNILKTSDKITDRVFNNYQNFDSSNDSFIYFSGTAFKELNILEYSQRERDFIQKNLCILSGLYGILRLYDNISLYRLDVADKLQKINLYTYWEDEIHQYFKSEKCILNLASQEYSNMLPNIFHKNMINIHFLIESAGVQKTIAVHTKRQRGKMLHFCIKNKVTDPEVLKKYSSDGFIFNTKQSTVSDYYFIYKK